MTLGVYVHWPYCARICPYCDFNVVRDRGRREEQAALKDAILADLAAHRRLTGPGDLVSIFLGGGTPSLLEPDWAFEIIAQARRLWTPAPDLEVALEANPTDVEAGRFRAFADAGVERLSLGLQALDDQALRFLGRNHDADEGRRAARLAGRLFPRLSVDMIYARPGQTAAAWRDELAQAADLGAGHISPYQLTIEPDTAFGRAVRQGRWSPPDADLAASLYDVTQAELEARGFDAYEVSNHALGPEQRSRHNLVYWTGADYVGAGPGAHGRLTGPDGRRATRAAPRIQDYVRQVRETGTGWISDQGLTPLEAAEERLLAGLRITEGVAWADLAPLPLAPAHPEVADLVRQGLLAPDTVRLRATAAGRLVLDHLTGRLALAAPLP